MDDPHLASVLADLDRLLARGRELTADLTAEQWAVAPSDGGWSIAQIFEHLRIADASYVEGALPKAIDKARGKRKKPWRSSLFGGWLRRALGRFDRKLPAPKIYRVDDIAPGADVFERWRDGVRALRAQVEAAEDLDLNTRLSSPVSKLIRISLGDALAIPVVHGLRHMAQVEARVQQLRGGAANGSG